MASARAGRTLVTGALGCIGAWTIKALLDDGEEPVGFDLGEDDSRLRLILDDDERERVTLVARRRDRRRCPWPRARRARGHARRPPRRAAGAVLPRRPRRGAHVNVRGTVVVFEAVKARADRISGLAYASSTAVYNASDPSPAPESGGTAPSTLYGVYKLANEGTARVFWQDDGVASIGIRPYVVYGPGRDQGHDVGADAGDGGRSSRRRLRDRLRWNGAVRLRARRGPRLRAGRSRRGDDGAHVANFPGEASTMDEVVAAIEAAAPEVAGRDHLRRPAASVPRVARVRPPRASRRPASAHVSGRRRPRNRRALPQAQCSSGRSASRAMRKPRLTRSSVASNARSSCSTETT